MPRDTDHNAWRADVPSSLRPSDSGVALLQGLLARNSSELADSRAFELVSAEAGSALIRAGEPFDALLLVKTGHLKTVFSDEGGNEQVVSFPVVGDLLGTDGISNGRYVNDVSALSPVELIRIPFTDLRFLQRANPGIVETLFQIISYQLVQEQLNLTAIGSLCADARIARFLLKIWYQMQAQDCSNRSLHLWMTRRDIGNYLGMKIETVSRTLTHLAALGLIHVDQRDVDILDANGLKAIAYDGLPRQGPLLIRQRKSRTKRIGSGSSSAGTNSRSQTASRGNSGRSSPWSGLLDL